MIGRKPTIISIVDEKQIAFRMTSRDAGLERQASLPLDDMQAMDRLTDAVPKWVRQTAHRLLVVPDYWIGNHFFEFQSRKRSIITAFVERKLRQEQPSFPEAVNFYDYSMVQDQDRRQWLYCTYLQEPMAYALYRQLASLGISPLYITTPALIWQSKLNHQVDGFAQRGIGFAHLTDGCAFLYFFHMGQFLFSRNIQLPDSDGDPSEVYNLLNYEINQSLYLYSQKSRQPVDTLFIVAQDPEASGRLSELLGREVRELSDGSADAGLRIDSDAHASCRGFTLADFVHHRQPAISYKPLYTEVSWRPVQWAGMVVGFLLIAFLLVEFGYLYLQWGAAAEKMVAVKSTIDEPPELILEELAVVFDEINRGLERPSGSGTLTRLLLSMPEAVAFKKITLDAVNGNRLSIDAVVDADQPDTFKANLETLIERINDRFDLKDRPLREKDIAIRLERSNQDEHKPLYLIQFELTLT